MIFILTQISLLFITLAAVSEGARILAVVVPKKALQGDEVHLHCDYSEEGSPLYSLKWYKDGKEFYRHVPASKHSSTDRCSVATAAPPPEGIKVNCVMSSEKEVVLSNVDPSTSGEYTCEMIGDHPDFRREHRRGYLTVHREPLNSPIIKNAKYEYNVGDPVNLTCTSANREYQPELSWIVNGQVVTDRELIIQYETTPVSLGLYFTANELRFIHGQMRVICKAKIGSSHIQSASKTLAIPGLLRPQYYSKASEPGKPLLAPLVIAAILSLLLF